MGTLITYVVVVIFAVIGSVVTGLLSDKFMNNNRKYYITIKKIMIIYFPSFIWIGLFIKVVNGHLIIANPVTVFTVVNVIIGSFSGSLNPLFLEFAAYLSENDNPIYSNALLTSVFNVLSLFSLIT